MVVAFSADVESEINVCFGLDMITEGYGPHSRMSIDVGSALTWQNQVTLELPRIYEPKTERCWLGEDVPEFGIERKLAVTMTPLLR